MSLLGKRYATALLLAARGAAAVDRIGDDLETLHGALLEPAVRALLTSPDLKGTEREAVLEKLGAGRHPLVQNLLQVLLRRRRLEVLFDLQPEWRALVMAERGEADGTVETPRPLGAEETRRLAEVAERLAKKKVALRVEVRPELIGGVRLRVGNVLFDGSVKSALDQLEQRLLQVPV